VTKTTNADPPWLADARAYLGTTEIPGPKHNAKIVQWWVDIRAAFRDDETPYCAAFVGAMLERHGIVSTRSAAARSYAKWGTKIDRPAVGAIVVFSRPGSSWSGHVGFAVGRDHAGNVMCLGANQGNTVSIRPFVPSRVISYHWPTDWLYLIDEGWTLPLPLLASNGRLSQNEA
jgi:uncharacterized protein (TIGR02594 family)